MAVTANDLITGALKRINAYAPGEVLANDDAQDALDTLNELLDSWSTDQASVYADAENILTFVPGQYQYTVGNYLSPTTFPGTVVEIRFGGMDDTTTYLLGSIEERSDELEVLSTSSPLGQVLLDQPVGGPYEYVTPAKKTVQVEIVSIRLAD